MQPKPRPHPRDRNASFIDDVSMTNISTNNRREEVKPIGREWRRIKGFVRLQYVGDLAKPIRTEGKNTKGNHDHCRTGTSDQRLYGLPRTARERETWSGIGFLLQRD